MRSLIYVPVVHTELDMGSLAERLEACYRARYGAGKWNEHLRTIHEMWQGIEERLKALKVRWSRVKIYQDGLPVCGAQEAQIVGELARQGSPNHRLVAQLMASGAQLIGTESPELLLREYRSVKRELDAGLSTQHSALSTQLLEERDRFVARRIQETLAAGETGLLFMGFAHEVHRYLPGDIRVRFLINWLPFRPDFGRQSTACAGRRASVRKTRCQGHARQMRKDPIGRQT